MLVPAGARAASEFFIRGGGDGHGIGMSQYGAYGYALHGKTYKWILHHYYSGTRLGSTNPNQIVRVLLQTGAAAFSGARKAGGKQLNPSLTYDVRPLVNGSVGVFTQTGKRVARGAAPLVVSGTLPLDVAGLGQYRGDLEFRPDGTGGVETVNALGLDDYVRGVISEEMPAGWSAQALEAQAVAARTYAITTTVGGDGYNLYPDTRSQMYGGVKAETPSTDAAVAATSGQVVTYNGAPVPTYFFNSSGGHTESIQNVWIGATPEPWLVGVPDPYDNAGGDPYHRWGSQMTTAAAQAKLRLLVKGTLIGIEVTEHGVSPRILTAEVVGTKGETTVTGGQLQQLFGLLTTYASFTTISSAASTPPAATARDATAAVKAPGDARAIAALLPLVKTLVARAAKQLAGRVFPAPGGGTVALESETARGGRHAASIKLGKNGAYAVMLPGPGTYRVVYRGLAGPSVSAG
jgi:stage II sporulation protein D